MQTVIHATQKVAAIDQQQHSCEMLICQRYQTILRLLSSAATASTRWRVHELYCPTTYVCGILHNQTSKKLNILIKLYSYYLEIGKCKPSVGLLWGWKLDFNLVRALKKMQGLAIWTVSHCRSALLNQ